MKSTLIPQPACPECQCDRTRVISSPATYRRYECDGCTHRFNCDRQDSEDLRQQDRRRSIPVIQPKAESKLSSHAFRMKCSHIEDPQARLRQLVLKSFEYRLEQSIEQIRQFCKGDTEKLDAVLEQLESEVLLFCSSRRPRRYRLVKVHSLL